MSPVETMTIEEYGQHVKEAGDRRNMLRQQVVDWMNAEGAAGRLRTNDQAPMWGEYDEAEKAFLVAVNAEVE